MQYRSPEVTEVHWLARVEHEQALCNLGEQHYVELVREVVLVSVLSKHDVYGTWTPRRYESRGVIAFDDQDRRFTRDYPTFDEASMGSHWSGPEGRWVALSPSKLPYLYDPDGRLEEYRRLMEPR